MFNKYVKGKAELKLFPEGKEKEYDLAKLLKNDQVQKGMDYANRN